MKKYFSLFAFCLYFSLGNGQSFISKGIGTASPDPSAVLDVSSNFQGFLAPRLTTVQRNAIVNPADGLLVYDLSFAEFWFFDGTQWQPIASGGGDNISLSFDSTSNNLSITDQAGTLIEKLNVDVRDNDFDPTNEIQDLVSWTSGTTVSINITGGNTISFNTNTNSDDFDWDRTGTNLHPFNIGDNVGIGTTSPSQKLEVVGNSVITSGLNVGFGGVPTQSRVGIGDANFYADRSNSNLPVLGFDTNDYFSFNRSSDKYAFVSGGTERLSVEGNGDIHVDGVKPFLIKKFTCSCDQPNRNTGFPISVWTAVIAGFYPTNTDNADTESTRVSVYANGSTGTWWFRGDLETPSSEHWEVDIMFIKNQLVQDDRPSAIPF